ncbi:MAG: transcriptional regulator [Bacillota bacterium]|nr:transcriptional regulator [Bacillota bacterium]MDD3298072.1 transcriptional regulator [Bacillota bacterium]MDD3851037.1 transcriptional regulator [Bacillota bacterium]MDD4707873.1 transcriptional regulator [Bacillota bacterium]
MDIVRVGNKSINKDKLYQIIDKIIEMRSKGVSQQDVAGRIGTDRTFVSRLESLGEVRKGDSVAFVAFPVENKQEIIELLDSYGVNFHLVMTEEERLAFVGERSGTELLNSIMDWIVKARQCDTVVIFASDKRSKLIEALVDCQVIRKHIGESPITRDVFIPPQDIIEVMEALQYNREG